MTEEQQKFKDWLAKRRLDELDWIWQAVIDARHHALLDETPPPPSCPSTVPSTKQADDQDNKKQPSYTDTDKMPWGKYRDKPMFEVPTSYLAWVWWTEEGCKDLRVKNYIWNSRHALNQELPEETHILKYRP